MSKASKQKVKDQLARDDERRRDLYTRLAEADSRLDESLARMRQYADRADERRRLKLVK